MTPYFLALKRAWPNQKNIWKYDDPVPWLRWKSVDPVHFCWKNVLTPYIFFLKKYWPRIISLYISAESTVDISRYWSMLIYFWLILVHLIEQGPSHRTRSISSNMVHIIEHGPSSNKVHHRTKSIIAQGPSSNKVHHQTRSISLNKVNHRTRSITEKGSSLKRLNIKTTL